MMGLARAAGSGLIGDDGLGTTADSGLIGNDGLRATGDAGLLLECSMTSNRRQLLGDRSELVRGLGLV